MVRTAPDTVRGLRDIVIGFAHVHVPTFVLDPSLAANKKVEALFLDFAIDLLSFFIQNVSTHLLYMCGRNKTRCKETMQRV
jgi:hypothetical protein